MNTKKYYKFRYENKLYSRLEASKLGKTRLSKDGKNLRVFDNKGFECTMILQECKYGQKYVDENEVKENNNEFDESNVNFFGTDVEIVNDKKGSFKSFHTKSWVQVNGEKIFVNKKINELKKTFPNFISSKRILRKDKKGKIKKATQWNCEVVEKGSSFLTQEDSYTVLDSIEKHTPFSLDHSHPFYYVHGNVFRDTVNDCLVYADLESNRLVRVNIEKPNKEHLEKWIKENINID